MAQSQEDDVLLTRKNVLATIGLRSTWLKGAIKRHEFPAPIRIGNRSLFSRCEVTAWVEARKAERDAQA